MKQHWTSKHALERTTNIAVYTNVVELSTKSVQNLTSVLTFTAIAWDN